MTYTVKELAEKMGVTQHTVRYYTDQGLLPCKRDKNNHRVFDEESVNWLEGIQCLRRCGISIDDIRTYCNLCYEGDSRLSDRYQFILDQRELAYQRLREVQETVEYMERKVRHYEDILSRAIPDDTNLAQNKNTPCY